jgi:hypothetical protein
MRFIAHIRNMREPTNVPSTVFSLRTSAFNDFLYAPVGEEGNGMVLTMLSALARSGVDPWRQAARLSELPREAAAKRLVSIISGMPRGQWAESEVEDIAARLADFLPVKRPGKSGSVVGTYKGPEICDDAVLRRSSCQCPALHISPYSRAVLSIRQG